MVTGLPREECNEFATCRFEDTENIVRKFFIGHDFGYEADGPIIMRAFKRKNFHRAHSAGPCSAPTPVTSMRKT